MIGELRFYRDATGKFSTVSRFITLDDAVPDNQVAKQLTVSAIDAETAARAASKQSLEDWLASSRMRKAVKSKGSEGASGPAYIGASRCSQCHREQYSHWSVTAHARATDPLPPRQFEFEASCLNCHATGRTSTRTASTDLPAFQNVQCEQCHGPGAEHAAKPARGYGRITDMKAACSTCHTLATSPGFDLKSAWAKIKH
jgi:hypothetical protein